MIEAEDVSVTRTAYDGVAELYTGLVREQLLANPYDRAVLGVFAESVLESEHADAPAAEVGCGPGRITDHLRRAGLDIFGLDLSPEMIRLARLEYPGLRFEVGSMERLELADAALGSIVAWYSIIHLPPARVPAVLAEFARVLRPGGHALFAFQAADGVTGVQPYDHKVTTSYRWAPDTLAEALAACGFRVTARMQRLARPDERTPQGYVLAVKDDAANPVH
ncbi:class I SAM-dependent methyltransferase [Nocardia sp. NPDC057668]|uniref:class I SAM-dependent methyltransferase n=1 Tax=Nocardia sp. NPDC057668 TaxID=3346202 RepID=UPI00366F9E94